MRGTQKQKNHLKWNAGNGVLHENEVIRSVFSMKVTVYISKFPPKKNIKVLLRIATKVQNINYEIFLTKWQILCNNLHRFIVLVCISPCLNSGYRYL